MKLISFYLIASLFLLTLTGRAEAATDADELAIYKVLFSGMGVVVLTKPEFREKPIKPDPSAIARDAENAARLRKNLPGVEKSTIANYQHCQLEPASLTPASDVGVKLVFVDRKVVNEMFRDSKGIDAGWKRFRERFHAGGLTTVSRVAFNSSGTQALVYMDYAYASLGAEGYTILLEKHDGKWKIVNKFLELVA